jgi:hypothetical protein
MKLIHIVTLLLRIALLSLSQLEYRALSPLAHLPDPAMAMPSSAVTFSNFVCCGCYYRGQGSRSTFAFASYKAVTTHISRSMICQRERKGVQTITMQYRPGSRGWSNWTSRGLASATRSASSGSRQVLAPLYIVQDIVDIYRRYIS